MMYLFPLLEVTGKRPVWSEKIFPVMVTTLAYTWWVWTGGSNEEGGVVVSVFAVGWGLAGVFFDVDRKFLGVAFRWPLAVASALGRYLRTASDVSPGHVVKNPWSIAWVQVEIVGLKHARCKNAMSFIFFFPAHKHCLRSADT